MNSLTDKDIVYADANNTLFGSTCNVGDRLMSPGLIESVNGIIMPREWVTVTKVTDYIVEVLSDKFVPMKFARL